MAERRMFAKTIIDSDAFLDMPLSTQALYFHLSMRADDDGFINNPKKIQRMIGCSDDDLKLLLAKNFIIAFESGVVVIKHWRIHNYIQSDRRKPTAYTEERAMLIVKENGAYTLPETAVDTTVCIQDGYNMDTQVRLGKVRLGKVSVGKDSVGGTGGGKPLKRFTPPTLDEVKAYCKERKKGVDAEQWYDYYSANGWKVGRNPMKDWKASVRYWERKEKEKANGTRGVYIDENDGRIGRAGSDYI